MQWAESASRKIFQGGIFKGECGVHLLLVENNESFTYSFVILLSLKWIQKRWEGFSESAMMFLEQKQQIVRSLCFIRSSQSILFWGHLLKPRQTAVLKVHVLVFDMIGSMLFMFFNFPPTKGNALHPSSCAAVASHFYSAVTQKRHNAASKVTSFINTVLLYLDRNDRNIGRS